MPAFPTSPITDAAPSRPAPWPHWTWLASILCLALLLALFRATHPAWGAAGTLRVIDSATEPVSLHPHRSFDQYSDVIITQIYEGLVDYDAKGRLVPRLAVRWQEMSPTRYRFWLRKGVRFHNGEPFDARAVQFSVDLQLHRRPPAANAMMLDPELRVEIVDSHTVDLVTPYPDARLPSTLPMFLLILPPKYFSRVGDDGLERHPVGTGPYCFAGRTPGHSIRLTANREYWEPGLPRIKDVTFLFVPRNQQVDALMQGRADLVTKLRGPDSLTVMSGPNTRVMKRQEAVSFWVSLKNYDSPFSDRRVRQAVNYAVNRAHLIEYVDKGSSASLANSIENGYNATLKPYPFDLERARRLLAEAGYPLGFKVRVLASEDTADLVQAIKSQLRMVGVEMELTIVPWKRFLRLVMEDKTRSARPGRRWDMTAWITSNPTLNAFFIPSALFYSQSPYSIMYDPAFDRQLLSYAREADQRVRREKLNNLQARAFNEAYGIYVAQRVQIYGLNWDLSIENHPTGMLTGRTLAEAYWNEQPGSLWDERSQPGKSTVRGRNATGNHQ